MAIDENVVPAMVDKYEEILAIIDNNVVLAVLHIYQQMLATFDNFDSSIMSNINKLKSLMDIVKAEDLNLDLKFKDPEMWKVPGKAPSTYIEVLKKNRYSMSIFVMRPGFKIPLHDHPQMYGLLKVISGKVSIKSFSYYPLKEKPDNTDDVKLMKHNCAGAAEGPNAKARTYAQISQDLECTASSQTCVLTPTVSNYHEIEALNEPAAFLEILGLGYDTPPCNTLAWGPWWSRYKYYEAEAVTNALVELKETEKPDWFQYDTANYSGPKLILDAFNQEGVFQEGEVDNCKI